MITDQKSLVDEHGEMEITKENRNLEEKYQDLIKEIKEKGDLMKKQMLEKDEGSDKIEKQMTE